MSFQVLVIGKTELPLSLATGQGEHLPVDVRRSFPVPETNVIRALEECRKDRLHGDQVIMPVQVSGDRSPWIYGIRSRSLPAPFRSAPRTGVVARPAPSPGSCTPVFHAILANQTQNTFYLS